jgi:signal transduction histidine kinase
MAGKNIELEHASRAKSEFLANMSHELRTPLNAILGFSEALKDGLVGDLQAAQREYVNDIYYSGAHLLAVINDILDLAKIEAGKMELDLSMTDLIPLLKNTVSVLRERAFARGVRVTMEAEPIAPFMIDQRKFRQIVFNLLSNAIKFTAEGGEVAVTLQQVERVPLPEMMSDDFISIVAPASRVYIELSVIDNGIGIEQSAIERLFQPFVQLDGGLTRKYDGTGLGLAIVKQLVDLLGGLLEVKSEFGCGSQFSVLFPLEPAVTPTPARGALPT